MLPASQLYFACKGKFWWEKVWGGLEKYSDIDCGIFKGILVWWNLWFAVHFSVRGKGIESSSFSIKILGE